jgi:RecA/RadA recombinase
MDREQALDTVLGQIERQFGKGAVMKMNDQAQVAIGAVSTGSLSLDVALGVGGLPRGRVVEVFGPESSGKTTLVYLHAVGPEGELSRMLDFPGDRETIRLRAAVAALHLVRRLVTKS